MQAEISQKNKAWLVSIPLGQNPSCTAYSSLDELLQALRQLVLDDQHVFIFTGERHYLSTGDFKFLVPAWSEAPIPLFDFNADDIRIAEDGYTGSLLDAACEAADDSPEDDSVVDDDSAESWSREGRICRDDDEEDLEEDVD